MPIGVSQAGIETAAREETAVEQTGRIEGADRRRCRVFEGDVQQRSAACNPNRDAVAARDFFQPGSEQVAHSIDMRGNVYFLHLAERR